MSRPATSLRVLAFIRTGFGADHQSRVECSDLANARCANDSAARMPEYQAGAGPDEARHKRGCSAHGTAHLDGHRLRAVLWVAAQTHLATSTCFEQILPVRSLHDKARTDRYPIQVYAALDVRRSPKRVGLKQHIIIRFLREEASARHAVPGTRRLRMAIRKHRPSRDAGLAVSWSQRKSAGAGSSASAPRPI